MSVVVRAARVHVPVELLRERAVSATALARVGCRNLDDLADAVASQFQLPRLALDAVELTGEIATTMPQAFAELHRIVPVFMDRHELTIAVCDPSALELFDWLGRETKRRIVVVVSTAGEIQRGQARLYTTTLPVAPTATEQEPVVTEQALVEASAIVAKLFAAALTHGASDIHIEAAERESVVRLRVDGVLRPLETWPLDLHAAIISRIKVLAGLDIALHQVPQDGRIKLAGPAAIDLRVSVLPTYYGEKVVCRVLDGGRAIQPLESLGFDVAHKRDLLRMLRAPGGLVLVTGPTGSGKSTTLYAALNAVKTADINVVTIEDPVEYQLAGINQVPVNPRRGMTFAAALRSILRQDPDVILVGEIRDEETGTLAAEAALTGHLVLSSMHTPDAIGAVLRLEELGVPRYLVAPTLLGVVSQRLVRRVCPGCAERYVPAADELASLGLPEVPTGTMLTRGRGCPACQSSGYAGRVAVREVLTLDDEFRGLITRGVPSSELRAHATSRGFRSMRFGALRLCLAGVTSSREVLRVVHG